MFSERRFCRVLRRDGGTTLLAICVVLVDEEGLLLSWVCTGGLTPCVAGVLLLASIPCVVLVCGCFTLGLFLATVATGVAVGVGVGVGVAPGIFLAVGFSGV